MCFNDVTIRVEGIGKCYQIYENPQDRLKHAIVARLQRFLPLNRRSPFHYVRDFWALRDISFDVKRGEAFGIIGRNGSGKSTLLQIICGTLTPTLGTVTSNGRIAALLELGAGFNPEFTGRENVYMNAALLGLTKNQIDERFDNIAAFADIGDFIDQPVKVYSSGMYVRLAFAVIAHVDADILVVDEALAVGDAFFVQKCMRFIRRFIEEGTLLFVSHDIGAVINLCRRAVLLDHGSMQKIGSAKEVSELYHSLIAQGLQEISYTSQEPGDNQENACRALASDSVDLLSDSGDVNHALTSTVNGGFEFGAGAARIKSVGLTLHNGRTPAFFTGGEKVSLYIEALVLKELSGVIVGFVMKDRLGQVIFGDNSFLAYADKPIVVSRGVTITADFVFTMPTLFHGKYSLCIAIAEGTQDIHVQHHWINDVLIIEMVPGEMVFGLIGLKCDDVRLKLI